MRPALALLLALVLLSGCTKRGTGAEPPAGGDELASGDNVVPCALAGAKDFARTCTLEQTSKDGLEIWVVRHPDGGFRRFQIIDNGTRIATADGSDEVKAERKGDQLEVRVADDRYLFQAAPEGVASSDAPRP